MRILELIVVYELEWERILCDWGADGGVNRDLRVISIDKRRRNDFYITNHSLQRFQAVRVHIFLDVIFSIATK